MLHVNGIHLVNLSFCGCDAIASSGTHAQQLLRRRWFPATHIDPQTVCTFGLLEQAHLLMLQSSVSLYDYYLTLARLTDNSGSLGTDVS